MRLVADNEIPEPSGFRRVPLEAGSKIKVIRAVEAEPCAACFLSFKQTVVLSLLLSRSISKVLSAFCHFATAL